MTMNPGQVCETPFYSFRFKAKTKNDKWRWLLSSTWPPKAYESQSNISEYNKMHKYSFFNIELCVLRAKSWVHTLMECCINIKDSININLSEFQIWQNQTFTFQLLSHPVKNGWNMKGAIQNSSLISEIWSVTLIDYKAKYSFPRSDTVFLLPLIHDKKTSYAFSKFCHLITSSWRVIT